MIRKIMAKFAELRGLKAEMIAREGALRREIANLHQLLNDYKSSQDVSSDAIEAFHAWRAATPIPEEPLVTICVATWDRPDLLVNRCLASILNQTYQKLQIIVVGDCSPTSTEEAMAEVRDSRVTFINLPRRGNYPATPDLRWLVAGSVPSNHALRAAQGDYITHLDDDDEYTSDRVEKLVGVARSTRADLVWHPFWIHRPDRAPSTVNAFDFRYGQVTTGSVFYRSWFKNIPWDLSACDLREPGDWNRFRKFLYLRPRLHRYPDALLHHFRR
jgi:glycosyltransferase involved in cell wall biosynthesis